MTNNLLSDACLTQTERQTTEGLQICQPENRRKLRVHAQALVGANASLRRETSPRRVECRLCSNLIEGNQEERITIAMSTGYHHPQKFWVGKQKVYFHIQCLVTFATGDGDMVHTPLRRRVCENCWTVTNRKPEKSGRVYCTHCSSQFGDRAIKRLRKAVIQLAEEAKQLVS